MRTFHAGYRPIWNDAEFAEERGPLNMAVVKIGCRNAALGRAAAAKRIGKVTIDHGHTACKTADAAVDIDKAWADTNTPSKACCWSPWTRPV